MALSAEKKVAMTLYFLKDTGSLAMTANTFGVAVSTVSKHIFEVCYAICIESWPQVHVFTQEYRRNARKGS